MLQEPFIHKEESFRCIFEALTHAAASRLSEVSQSSTTFVEMGKCDVKGLSDFIVKREIWTLVFNAVDGERCLAQGNNSCGQYIHLTTTLKKNLEDWLFT